MAAQNSIVLENRLEKKSPRRIIHVGKYFPPKRGGMESFLHDLIIEQKKQGLDVQALVHRTEKSLRSTSESYESNNVSVTVIRVARWFTFFFAPISPSFGVELWRTIRDFKPDIIHLHLPNLSAFWCLLLPNARKIPWVVHWQSDIVLSTHNLAPYFLYRIYKYPETWLLKRSKKIIATSPPYLKTSIPLSPYLYKTSVIPLGIRSVFSTEDENRMPDEPSSAPEDDSLIRVLTVARLTHYKGLDVLLHAISQVPQATLTLIGDGDEAHNLFKIANSLKLGTRFTHIKDCSNEELRLHYLNHDLFCLASTERTEAFGVVLLEAMRAGLPCLVSEIPGSGMSWVVDSPSCGYSVTAGNAAALADKLKEIRAHPEKMQLISKNAKTRFNQLFTISNCASAIQKIYTSAASEK
jgi:glycosyltransferase involved in cell wall biosynthesis